MATDQASIYRWRPLLFGLLLSVVLLWPKATPPDLSEHNIRQVSGRYACQRWPLSVRSGRVDGIRFASDFGYVFGYGIPGFCFEQLNGRMVLARYVETPSPNPPFLLSLQDEVTGTVWGASEEDQLKRMRTYLAQPWWFRVWQGVGVLVLVLLFFPRLFQRGIATVGRITRLSD
mgnify:CR=1 FL=1